jgi:pyrroline-5-carboxylate reductase
MNKTIGLIGYGHLGHAIHERAGELNIDLQISEGKGQNAELAAESDTLILTVQPGKIAEVLDEVRAALKDTTSIVSFAAAGSIDKMVKSLGREKMKDHRITRAMTDINLRQVLATYRMDTVDLCQSLSRNDLVSADNENDITRFTVYVGCLPGVAAWQFANNQNADAWLRGYLEHIEYSIGVPVGVTWEIVREIQAQGNFEQTVQKVATKGGVTEALIQALEQGHSDYTYLHDVGFEKIEMIEHRLKFK